MWKSWMNRTPRSASRRASRQFAAYVPGLRTFGPYMSTTASDSFDVSVSSGTLDCIRNASSYCEIRVAISGSLQRVEPSAVERPDFVQHLPPGVPRNARRVAQPQHRVAAVAELHPLVLRRQKPAPPQPVVQRLDRPAGPVPLLVSTTYDGRSLFSLPSP
jgi:hypothetical protein